MSRVRRPPLRVAGALTALAVIGAALVAGCTSTADTAAASPAAAAGPSTEPSTTVKDAMTDDPTQALAIAGLALPPGATGASVAHKDVPGYNFAYTVTFMASRSAMDGFVEQATGAPTGSLSVLPAGPAGAVLADTTVTAVREDSRFAATSFPAENGYGNLTVLVDGPDLTTVHVGIAGFPS